MNKIGATNNFRIEADVSKNRVIMTVSGEALASSENKEAPLLMEKACALLGPGFTCLADHTGLKLFGLPDIAAKIMQVMLTAGVSKIATVWPSESFAQHVVGGAAKSMGDQYLSKRKIFTDLDSARAWLDE